MKKELGTDAKGNYLPLRTDDEGRPVSPDTYIDDKIYSEEEMVSLFRKVNPGRKTRAEMTDFFPPLTGQNADGYFIMFDRANPLGGEPLPVGRVGWKYLQKHKLYLTTGIKIIDMYRGMGLSRSLWRKRDSEIIKNTPAIGMASNFSESWIKLIESEGWKIDPPVESLPESIQDEVRETIEGEKPRRLISKNIDVAMKKAWEILKTTTTDFQRFLVEVFGIPRAEARKLTASPSLQQSIGQGRLTEFITEREFEQIIDLVESKQYEALLRGLEGINSRYLRTSEERKNEKKREKYANDPEYRERILESNKERRKIPENKEKRNRRLRERYANDPEFRKKRREQYERQKERKE